MTFLQPSDLLEVIKKRKTPKDIGIAPEADEDEDMHEPPRSSPAFELRKNDFKSSTKLNALIAHLRKSLNSSHFALLLIGTSIPIPNRPLA